MISESRCNPKDYSILSYTMPKTTLARIIAVASVAIAVGVLAFVYRRSCYKKAVPAERPAIEFDQISINRDLEAWARREKESNASANTEVALERLRALGRFGVNLDLRDLNLSSLPESIGMYEYLMILNLEGNKLKNLPDSIKNLKELCFLELQRNELENIPDCIRSLESLSSLNLGGNRLRGIPYWIGELQKLEMLRLSYNKISNSDYGNIFTWFSSYWFKSMPNLKELYLDHNKLKNVPDSIKSMPNLENLHLAFNGLNSLPSWISRMQNLKYLTLSRNPLNTTFDYISYVSRNCTVYLTVLYSDRERINSLREQFSREGDNGPTIYFTVVECNRTGRANHERVSQPQVNRTFASGLQTYQNRPTRSLDKLCQDLTKLSGDALPEGFIEEHKGNEALTSFLKRLDDTHDFRNGRADAKKALAKKLVAYLNLMHVNNDYAESFNAIVEGESDHCGDRIALAIIRLGIAKRLLDHNLSDLNALADFLKRGVWTVGSCIKDQYVIGLLEEIAEKKIRSMRVVDDVEVYLAYFVKFKEVLNLPIDISEMLYYGLSDVSQMDLEKAASDVRAAWNDKDRFYKFLIGQSTWVKALETRFPNDYNMLNDKRYDTLDEGEADEAQAIWNEGLLDLTRQALG